MSRAIPGAVVFLRRLVLIVIFAVPLGAMAAGQSNTCAAVAPHDATPAEEAYAQAKYDAAETLYVQAAMQRPQDMALSSALVHTLLHEDKVADAAVQAKKALAADPRSASALTALAEVQIHQGEPWLALQTLDAAAIADACLARTHLIRSRIFRIDSMYASERRELQLAYDIDPTDPDIRREWLQVDSPAKDIEGTENALATMSNVDADLREKAMASVHSLMGQLSENSQTCKSSPALPSAVTLPLIPSLQDAKHITGYQLEVQFPQGKAKLQVDTAASGLYISRALADANGFQRAAGEPANTVHVDRLHIGPLEFRDCMVGVSDTPFLDKGDGFISTDIFAPYLITLNYPAGRLELAQLPALPGQHAGSLPGDRYVAPETSSYSPVYHRLQYLLVPVTLNKKERRLFVLDSGIRLSTMTPEVAHLISTTRVNFTNSVQTVSGGTLQLYRDNFDFQFANLSLDNQGHILDFDPSVIDQNAGFEVAGMLGFDMLHVLAIHLDYRDGLVRFDAAGKSVPTAQPVLIARSGSDTAPSNAQDCDRNSNQLGDLPLNTTIEAKAIGWIDSGHLKPGQPIALKVVNEWTGEGCTLPAGAALYGSVMASTHGSSNAQLALAFDRGDCVGHTKKQLSLRVIGVVGPADHNEAFHNAMPTEVAGGGRDISVTAAAMGLKEDENLNPGGPPHTVHPGIVVGLQGLTMTPEGGPQCSALLTTSEHSVHLGVGSEFILTMEKDQQ
jgi:tetratricopeptide (TPR) repeat protein